MGVGLSRRADFPTSTGQPVTTEIDEKLAEKELTVLDVCFGISSVPRDFKTAIFLLYVTLCTKDCFFQTCVSAYSKAS